MLLPIFTLNFNEKLLVDRVAIGKNNTKKKHFTEWPHSELWSNRMFV